MSIKEKKYSLFTFFLALMILIPLIMSRSDFQDDMYRTTSGYTDFWFENARPISVWIFRIINQGYVTPDISPLTYILSFMILFLSGRFLATKITKNNDNFLKNIITIIFLSSPFLTAILSYKYDCLPVSVAISIAVMVTFLKLKSSILKIIIQSLSLFIIFSIYQPVLAIFIGILGLKLLNTDSLTEVKEELIQTSYSLISIILSFFIYKKIIADNYLNDFYKSRGSIVHITKNGFEILIKNIEGYSKKIFLFIDYPSIYIPILLLSLLTIYTILRKKKYLEILKVTLALPFILTAGLSCNIVLEHAAIQFREMLGVFFIFLSLIIISRKANFHNSYTLIIILTSGLYLTNLMISYSLLNYKDQMAELDNRYIQQIDQIIVKYSPENIKSITIIPSARILTKKMQATENAYPILRDFIFENNFSNIWYAKALINEENNIGYPIKDYDGDHVELLKTSCNFSSQLVNSVLYLKIQDNCS